MKTINAIITIGIIFFLFSCGEDKQEFNITVKNDLDFDRQEVVEVGLDKLDIKTDEADKFLIVIDNKTGNQTLNQTVDSNGDGVFEKLLFFVEIGEKEEKSYTLSYSETKPEVESKVFSRFVPERTDDFAWENDRVAFRTYGPTAQKMVEDGTPGGTLSSGIDCWLKKVDYPIINKWYKKHTSGEGSYHEDTGEGLDNFHVGASRGCGGLGVYVDEELYASKNFTGWKIYSNGPLRTSFTLDYDDWQADKVLVKEQKVISLDLGSNLMKIEAKITGPDVVTVGLTLHENEGEISVDTTHGCFSYWQPHGDSELGTAIVCHPKYFAGYSHVVSAEPDKSHLLVHLKVIDGKVEYYTGFNWKESGQFNTIEDWNATLSRFSESLVVPLDIEI